jgi:hypothetical protein
MGDELMNAPTVDVAKKGEANELHQNVAKSVV